MKGFIKGEALRLLRTNSTKTLFEENIRDLKSRLWVQELLVNKVPAGVQFTDRKSALRQKPKSAQENIALCHRTQSIRAKPIKEHVNE